MSAFLQTLSVRFAGRPPARPSRTGHPFHRGQLMPQENLGGGRGLSPPRLRAIVWASAAQRLRGAAAPSRVSTVAAPVGCLQPAGLA